MCLLAVITRHSESVQTHVNTHTPTRRNKVFQGLIMTNAWISPIILTHWVISFIMDQFLIVYLKFHHLVSIFNMAVESVTQGYKSSAPDTSRLVGRLASTDAGQTWPGHTGLLLDEWKHPLKLLRSFDRKSLYACFPKPLWERKLWGRNHKCSSLLLLQVWVFT